MSFTLGIPGRDGRGDWWRPPPFLVARHAAFLHFLRCETAPLASLWIANAVQVEGGEAGKNRTTVTSL